MRLLSIAFITLSIGILVIVAVVAPRLNFRANRTGPIFGIAITPGVATRDALQPERNHLTNFHIIRTARRHVLYSYTEQDGSRYFGCARVSFRLGWSVVDPGPIGLVPPPC